MQLNWLQLELLDLFLSWQTQQEQRKLACAMPNAAIYCLSKKDDSYCCLFLFIHRIIFYMCKRHVLPQIAQITQRNTASCIISQRKTVWCLYCFGVSLVLGFVVLGFVCVNQRDLREIYCGFICAILTEYACVFVSRRLRGLRREGMQQSCIISQRKTVWS